MKLSHFFIDRPIFAIVLSLLIVVGGGIALFALPISEYPGVVPPTVVVRGVYPGANPKVIAETVASPLEHQINGVEGLLYMYSQSTADGVMTLTATFALGTDLDNAQVQIQNRVAQTLPRLPQEVQRIGVVTEKATPDFLMVVHLVSPDSRYDMLYLSNFAHLQVRDQLTRIAGVGNAQVFGAGEYSMRVWIDPDKLAARQMTATDVVHAIREQNLQVAAGVLGAPPAPTDMAFQLSINAQGRLNTEEEFENIVVRATPDGQITKLKDVGRVELGSSNYALRSMLDNQPAAAIGIFQRPGSNAIEASAEVRATMETLKQSFPEGVDYRIVYDPTIYVRESIAADESRVRSRAEALGIADRVFLLGMVPQPEVARISARARVVAVPVRRTEMTLRHTSPLKAFEAMAAGRPILASDLPSSREFLRHGENAWLVPPDDPVALAEGLARLLGDDALSERIARTAFADAVAFSWDARARRLLDVFAEIA